MSFGVVGFLCFLEGHNRTEQEEELVRAAVRDHPVYIYILTGRLMERLQMMLHGIICHGLKNKKIIRLHYLSSIT